MANGERGVQAVNVRNEDGSAFTRQEGESGQLGGDLGDRPRRGGGFGGGGGGGGPRRSYGAGGGERRPRREE